MNRTDRLLAIVLELQGGGRRTAERLARTFGVSLRTIYRDVRALEEAGVPLVSAPGQGYWLMEGYFLPPLHFSPDEATLLLLGAEVMAQSFDRDYRQAAEAARRKIEGVLSPEQRGEIAYLRDNIVFADSSGPTSDEVQAALYLLRRALVERRTVRFRYLKRREVPDKGDPLERRVDPHNLFQFGGVWMMAGYCHLRAAMRTFRLNRMEALRLTPEIFERRTSGMVRRQPESEERTLEVRARFAAESARWVRESHSYYITRSEIDSEGLLVTLQARRIDELLPWLLSWGDAVTVLGPESVRRRLQQEGEKMARRYADRLLDT